MAICPDAEEEINSGMLPPKHKLLTLVTCYDYDLAHGRVTKISIGIIVGMIGKNSIIQKPKIQTIIETSTRGAELNVERFGIKY